MPKTLSLLAVLKKVDAKGVKSLSNAQWNTFLASDTEPNEIQDKIKKLEGYEEKFAVYDATGELIVEDNQAMIDRFKEKTGRSKGRESFKVKKTKINVGEFLGKDRTPDKSQNPDIGGIFNDDEDKKDDVGPKGMESKVGRLARILRDTRGRVLKLEEEKKKGPSKKLVTDGLDETVNVIAEKVVSIEDTLKEQIKVDTENAKLQKQQLENEKRDSEESRLGKVTGFLKKTGDKIIAPVQNIFSKIFGFIKKLILGKILLNIIKWFGNPENQGKIQSVIKFLGNNWKKLLSLYLVFGSGLGRFVRFITKVAIRGTIKLIALAAKLAVAKGMKGAKGFAKFFGGKKGRMLGNILTIGSSVAMYSGVNSMLGGDGNKEGNKEGGDGEVQNFNKGGKVRGQGDKDTVPAMLTPGEFVMSKGAVQQYGVDTMEAMNAAAGGTNVPVLMPDKKRKGFPGGGRPYAVPEGASAYTGKDKKDQEAYMLHWVNKEREFQGLPPLTNLTYAPNVYLTKARGPGPRINEQSNTVTDLDRGVTTKTKSRTVDGKTEIIGKIGQSTDKEREKFFAENPQAAQLLTIKNQAELDSLGSDVSASAKKSAGYIGGGLVSNSISNSISNFNGGGLVQYLNNGGQVISASENATMRGGKVVSGNMSQSNAEKVQQKLKLEKAKFDAISIYGYNSPETNEIRKQILILQGIPAEAIYTDRKGNLKTKGYSTYSGKNQPSISNKSEKNPANFSQPQGSGGGFMDGIKRAAGGFADYATLGMFDFDKQNRKGAPKDFGIRRIVGGLADAATMGLTDFDKRGRGIGQFNPIGGGKDKAWGAADEQAKRGEAQSGFGLKRGVGGVMDQMTGNMFDFDKQSGGGLLRKTANAIGGLFDKGTGDKVMGKEPKIKEIKIPSEGLESILIKIASKQDIKTPVGQPSLSGPKITVIPEKRSINTPMSNQGGGGKAIPRFDAGNGSSRKMKQLGISR